MNAKIDFKRTIPSYRARRDVPEIVDVPDLQYLMVDGHGDPNTSPEFTAAVEALYPLAYTLKFASRSELGRDHVVMPLEGLWWADDMTSFTSSRDKETWDWTLMIMVPDWIDHDLFATAVDKVATKSRPERLDDVRLETLVEGRCVQALHVGSYDDEAELLARMHDAFIPEHGLRMTGRHHEVYLSDARRVAPGRRRTILRQPVRPAD
ncbi:GyrI-like domain-containing protein [Aeromicrobium sp. Leaf350]|uniref:GyrI-like domain-containing protein n=1 Tax=Aeromicrobium sp. Leaf350 TaxID=2876565 RepID=UPI001E445AFE|nr:GyrI-like domain-containing protein [Aeromicrobium sp. Leaf350]